MAETPQASPSSPSMRLTEFVQPTIHNMVTGTARIPMVIACSLVMSSGLVTTFIMMPESTAMTAESICTPNLSHALRFRTSSIAPTTAMSIAPTRMPRTWVVMLAKSSTEIRKPVKIARPPMRGIGWLWICRFLSGISMAPTFTAKFFTAGVAMNEMTNAETSARMIFIHAVVL